MVGYDKLILRGADEDKLTATQYKSGHRRTLTEAGYTFVGCAGDQISDCNGGFGTHLSPYYCDAIYRNIICVL